MSNNRLLTFCFFNLSSHTWGSHQRAPEHICVLVRFSFMLLVSTRCAERIAHIFAIKSITRIYRPEVKMKFDCLIVSSLMYKSIYFSNNLIYLTYLSSVNDRREKGIRKCCVLYVCLMCLCVRTVSIDRVATSLSKRYTNFCALWFIFDSNKLFVLFMLEDWRAGNRNG